MFDELMVIWWTSRATTWVRNGKPAIDTLGLAGKPCDLISDAILPWANALAPKSRATSTTTMTTIHTSHLRPRLRCFSCRDWVSNTPTAAWSGLDGYLDGLAPAHDVDCLAYLTQRQGDGDEVGDGHLAGRDQVQCPGVVGRAGAVSAHDGQLAVVHEVRVAVDERLVLREAAEEADPAPAGGHPYRLLLRGAGGRGGDHDVRPAPVGELEQLIHRVGVGRTDRRVRPDQGRCHLQPLLVEVGEEDPRGAAGTSQPDVQPADRARADDYHVVAGAHAGQFLAVEHARQRLSHSGLGEADRAGNAVQPADGQDLGRDDHVVGETPVILESHEFLIAAHRHSAEAAFAAGAAGNGGDDLHPVSRRPAVYVCTRVRDLPGDLVSHDPRRRDAVMPGPEDLDVGPADAAVAHADLHFGLARARLGGRFDPDVSRSVKTCDFH